jgi:hypothetical protein
MASQRHRAAHRLSDDSGIFRPALAYCESIQN